ncbi:MAG TPA: tetratricopeptide repeat protein [Ktedonobacterales bacterium]
MADGAGEAFGVVLRRQRRAVGLTQEELAARAGLSARGIADLERGARHTPRRDTVELLARALGGSQEIEAVLFAALAAARRATTPASAADATASDSGGTTAGAPRTPPRHNLPAQVTSLLGRDEAMRAAVALARRADVRLVTLTGPGGVGKTRLAVEVAAQVLDDYADGVWFVRLSRLTDPALVLPAIAATLDLKESGGQPTADLLADHLRQRRLLLVLDNCEQVAAAAPDVAALLEVSPALKVLATSRAALRLRGEHEYPVAPLGVPPAASAAAESEQAPAPEALLRYPAAALFVERARAVLPDFALTAANAPDVATICARLDGLPLAIELAAARVKLLPPATLRAQLERGLGLLTSGARDQAERQQAIHSTIAWSERLLGAGERTLFRRLAVFAGGCTLEAAQAVCGVPVGVDTLAVDVLEGLGTLVDQSLVQQREEGGEARFGMLHVIREYALAQLDAVGATGGRPLDGARLLDGELTSEVDALRRAHAAWMLSLAERAQPELAGPDAAAWLDRVEREHDNLRTALGWTCARGEAETGLRLVAAIFRFWVVRGHLREGRALAERVLALEPVDAARNAAQMGALRARALRAAGVLALYQADDTAAGAWLEQAVELAREGGDLQTAAYALNSLGVTAMHQGDLARARALLEESLAYLRAVGEPRGIASTLVNLGLVAFFQGDLEQAEASLSEALALTRQAGDRDSEATALANLASVAMRRKDLAQAETLGRAALALYHDLGDPRRCAVGLEGLAGPAAMTGNGRRAARLLGAAAALRETLGTPTADHERGEVDETTTTARAALGAAAWSAAYAAGQALTLDAAIAEALGAETTEEALPGNSER